MSESLFCANFDISFSLFGRKSVQSWMRRFWAKKCRRDHLRSLWRSVVPVKARRWQHREAAEGRWGSLTKCGITKLVTVRHGYDGPFYRFVVKIREVIPVPRFQELKYFETRPSRDRCAYDGPSHLPSRGMKKAAEEIAPSMGWRSPRRSVATTTVHRVVRRPSRVLADFQQLESLFN